MQIQRGTDMAKVLVTESYLSDIADAIRNKNGTSNTYTPAQMASAIGALGTETKKCGVVLDDVIGDLSSAGQLALPNRSGTISFDGVKSVAAYALAYKFYRNAGLTGATFPDLTTISTSTALAYLFSTCTHLASLSFPKLTTVSGTTSCEYLAYNCAALASVSFPKLTTIGVISNSTNNRNFYYAFNSCSALTEVRFPLLTHIYCNGTSANQGTFAYAFNRTVKLYFPKLTFIGKGTSYTNETAAKSIFYSCTGITEIHFASANKTAIEGSTGYSTKWGATNATLYFDL